VFCRGDRGAFCRGFVRARCHNGKSSGLRAGPVPSWLGSVLGALFQARRSQSIVMARDVLQRMNMPYLHHGFYGPARSSFWPSRFRVSQARSNRRLSRVARSPESSHSVLNRRTPCISVAQIVWQMMLSTFPWCLHRRIPTSLRSGLEVEPPIADLSRLVPLLPRIQFVGRFWTTSLRR